MVDRPFHRLIPVARHPEDHQLPQAGWQRTFEAQIGAGLLQARHQRGAAQQRNERPLQRAARPGQQIRHRLVLGLAQLLGRYGGKAVGRGVVGGGGVRQGCRLCLPFGLPLGCSKGTHGDQILITHDKVRAVNGNDRTEIACPKP